jgi:hypothetical protein
VTERRIVQPDSVITSGTNNDGGVDFDSWKDWKPTLLKEIGDDIFASFDDGVQQLLQITYLIRRKRQLGMDATQEIQKTEEIETKLGGFEKIHSNPKVDRALMFINNRVRS